MNDILVLLVGSSGSGKTAIAEYLRDYHNFRILPSYTTRPRRADSKDDHIYIEEKDVEFFFNTENVVAYNKYKGNHYFATEKQCDDSDVYVVDVEGLKQLRDQYNKKIILSFYVETSPDIRIQRMRLRGDTEKEIEERLNVDKKEFAEVEKECDFTINNDYALCIATQQILAIMDKVRHENDNA